MAQAALALEAALVQESLTVLTQAVLADQEALVALTQAALEAALVQETLVVLAKEALAQEALAALLAAPN